MLDHIGLVGLQSIPNDGTNRDPYLHFVHGAGRIVIAPTGTAPDAPWKFTARTTADIRDLYRATENLPPPLATPPGLIPPSTYFTLRGLVAKSAPFLLGRVGELEYWQLHAAMSARTATSTDDILFTLLLAAARLGVVFAVCLAIAYFLSIPTTNILAGLGIGGLAFASRETLSNVFGAGILVPDRPFRRGDWIKAGDIEGAIEDVGIRSTRVRTAQDSVVVVPNGKLVDSTINNLGTRRHRLIKAQLLVTAGGTPRLRASSWETAWTARRVEPARLSPEDIPAYPVPRLFEITFATARPAGR